MIQQILTNAAIFTTAGFFLAGLVITALTGSARGVIRFFGILSGLFAVLLVLGFWLTRGLLIFLFFQIVALILVLYLISVLGAVCGGGLYALRQRKAHSKQLPGEVLPDYVPLVEFCAKECVEEDRALARIKSGYYAGGQHRGAWYVHKSELKSEPV